jgi:hypothetical protein
MSIICESMTALDRGRSENDRPLLFLDVDGVLNCPGPRQDEHEFVKLGGLPVFIPKGTKERVHRLLEVYDPVWCTAWLGSAHSAWRHVLELDGLPWPYVNYRQYKIIDLLKMAGDRLWAYVDDDVFGYELKGLGWTEDMVSGLLIQPDPYVGLTDEHVRELLIFANDAEPDRTAA